MGFHAFFSPNSLTLAKQLSRRLSKSSVTLPPYCTSPIMYRTVLHDTPFIKNKKRILHCQSKYFRSILDERSRKGSTKLAEFQTTHYVILITLLLLHGWNCYGLFTKEKSTTLTSVNILFTDYLKRREKNPYFSLCGYNHL